MELTIYNQHNALHAGKTDSPNITFRRGGQIRISKSLVKLLNIKPGDQIEFAQDPKNSADWYFRMGSADGLVVRKYKREQDNESLNLNSGKVCGELLNSIEAEKASARIRVALTESEEFPGWYPLITASAKK